MKIRTRNGEVRIGGINRPFYDLSQFSIPVPNQWLKPETIAEIKQTNAIGIRQ
jgi:hypothetical protein